MTPEGRLLMLVAELRAAREPQSVATLASLLDSTPATVRRALAELHRHGLDTAAGAGHRLPPPAAPQPMSERTSPAFPVMEVLATAIRTGRAVTLVYTDQSGGRSVRVVDPHGLVIAAGADYLAGWCRLRRANRSFRVDRILAAALSGPAAEPADRDHAQRVLDTFGSAVPAPPAGAETWILQRTGRPLRLLERAAAALDADRSGAEALRVIGGHLIVWSRWHVAGIAAIAAATLTDDAADTPNMSSSTAGPQPEWSDDPVDWPLTEPGPLPERAIQDAMAGRPLDDLVAELGKLLAATESWATRLPPAWWPRVLPDPVTSARSATLADLVAGWGGPIAHAEWHLDGWLRTRGSMHARSCPLTPDSL